jgi:heat shock protein HtpX
MWIVNPFQGGWFVNMFSTHPPIEQRIRRLRQMEGAD